MRRSAGHAFLFVACLASCALLGAAPTPSPQSPTMRPTPVPTPKLTPPPATAGANTPDGIIGPLERNRKTNPSAFASYVASQDPALAARAVLALGRLRNPSAIPMVIAVLTDASRPSVVRQM